MKHINRNILCLVAMVTAAWMQADTLTVCDGDRTNANVPLCGNNYDQAGQTTQFIYPAHLLTDLIGRDITGLRFYANKNGVKFSGGKLQVSVGETADTVCSQTVQDLTVVATMGVDAEVLGTTEFALDFSTPFAYNGGNLVIETCVLEGGDYGHTYFVGQAMGYSAARSGATSFRFLPKVTWIYSPPKHNEQAWIDADFVDFGSCEAHQSVSKSVLVRNIGVNRFMLSASDTGYPFSSAFNPIALEPRGAVEVPITFSPDRKGEYRDTLVIDAGAAGLFRLPLCGTATDASLTVCDDAENDTLRPHVPFYALFYDSHDVFGQMIYPADSLIAMQGCVITSVTFYTRGAIPPLGGEVTLSAVITGRKSFDDGQALTHLSPLATMTPITGDTLVHFEFPNGFIYQGGNLAFQAEVTVPGTYGSVYYHGKNMPYPASYYTYFHNIYGTQTIGTAHFLPKATFTFSESEVPVVWGDINGDGVVDVGDVNAIINIILSKAQPVESADLDHDGHIDVGDVNAIINAILGQ